MQDLKSKISILTHLYNFFIFIKNIYIGLLDKIFKKRNANIEKTDIDDFSNIKSDQDALEKVVEFADYLTKERSVDVKSIEDKDQVTSKEIKTQTFKALENNIIKVRVNPKYGSLFEPISGINFWCNEIKIIDKNVTNVTGIYKSISLGILELLEGTIDAEIEGGVGDIAIGTIELKDAKSGLKATVKSSNGDGALVVTMNDAPLPFNSATESTLVEVKADTSKLDVDLSTRASESTLAGIKTQIDNLNFEGTALKVSSGSFILDISRGLVANTVCGVKAGERANISTTILQDVIMGGFSEPLVASQLRVVSSSTSDTGSGVGARKVRIEYLDSTWIVKITDITLNGTAAVNTVVNDILHIESFYVIEVGSSGSNVGVISLQSTDGATTYAQIPIGRNFSPICRHHVPAGKVCFLTQWSASATVDFIYFYLYAEENFYEKRVFLIRDLLCALNPAFVPLNCIKIREKCHIKVSALARSGNSTAVVSFQYIEKDI